MARGALTPESFVGRLWQEVLAQFLVCDNSTALPYAYVSLHQADLLSRTVWIDVVGLQGAPSEIQLSAVDAGLRLTVDHAFLHWDMRKIYVEYIDEPGSSRPELLAGFQEEARFQEDFQLSPEEWCTGGRA